ncbi:Uncharacterised protein [Vibrio cholerae]|nr:Uncharacterised protein [Vibrio cholerae]CSI29879.1 Uncharacterised protein [Vibrio cholerae]
MRSNQRVRRRKVRRTRNMTSYWALLCAMLSSLRTFSSTIPKP